MDSIPRLSAPIQVMPHFMQTTITLQVIKALTITTGTRTITNTTPIRVIQVAATTVKLSSTATTEPSTTQAASQNRQPTRSLPSFRQRCSAQSERWTCTERQRDLEAEEKTSSYSECTVLPNKNSILKVDVQYKSRVLASRVTRWIVSLGRNCCRRFPPNSRDSCRIRSEDPDPSRKCNSNPARGSNQLPLPRIKPETVLNMLKSYHIEKFCCKSRVAQQ